MKNRRKFFVVIIALISMVCFSVNAFAMYFAEYVGFDERIRNENAVLSEIVEIDAFSNGGYVDEKDFEFFGVANLDEYWDEVTNSEIVKEIYDGLQKYELDVWLDRYQMSADDLGRYYKAALNLYPDLYFVSVYYQYYLLPDGSIESLAPIYILEPDQKAEVQKGIDAEVDKIMATLDDTMSELDKLTAVNEYFNSNYTYDFKDLYNNDEHSKFTMNKLFNQKTAVCQGFAYGYKYIMDKLNIPCTIVQSQPMAHMWNQVKIDNSWYHIDTTHNNTASNGSVEGGIEGRSSKEAFLASDTRLQATKHDNVNYNTYEPDGRATDLRFDSYDMFKSSMSMSYKDGYWYYSTVEQYTDDEGKTKYRGYLERCSLSDGTVEKIADIECNWRLTGGSYYPNNVYSAAVVIGDMVYYNTEKEIRRYNTATGEDICYIEAPEGVVYNDVSHVYKAIYGMSISEDGTTFDYVVADNNALANKEEHNVNPANVPEPTPEPTPAPTPTPTPEPTLNPDKEVSLSEVTVDEENKVVVTVSNNTEAKVEVKMAYFDESGRFVRATTSLLESMTAKHVTGEKSEGESTVSVFVWKEKNIEPLCPSNSG